MSSFGQLIEKAKDKDKQKIIEVMKWTLKKDEKDTIKEQDIKNVKVAANKLQDARPDNSWEADSFAKWADKYQTFINNATKKGGKKKRKRTRKRMRKRTRKRTRKRRRKKQKGGVLLLGAYAAYKYFTKNKKKRRRRKTKKR